MSTALRTVGLGRDYGKGEALVRAVDDFSFEVSAGETVAVTGPSGGGKSTLLNLLGCYAASPARAPGASRREVTAALVSAQVPPAACGAVSSVPIGALPLMAAGHTGHVEYPPLWQTFSLVVASVLVTAALTALPARRAAVVSSVWATSP